MTTPASTQPSPPQTSAAMSTTPAMTDRPATSTTPAMTDRPAPPLSRAARIAAGVALVLAGLLNGGLQYVDHLVVGSGSEVEQLAWGLAHEDAYRALWLGVTLSLVLLVLGFLGLAQVTRWHTPRLTAVAIVLVTWGMSGFATILGGTYVANVVAPRIFGVVGARRLVDDGYLSDWGMLVGGLIPHLVGSFLGGLLLAAAGWRSRLPRVPLALLVAFLLWDFLFVPVGPLEPHLLLMVALVWLGTFMIRLPHARWLGQTAENQPAHP